MRENLLWIFVIYPCLIVFSIVMFLLVGGVVAQIFDPNFLIWIIMVNLLFPLIAALTIILFQTQMKKNSVRQKVITSILLALVSIILFVLIAQF